VVDTVRNAAPTATVTRLAGDNRYTTAVTAAQRAYADGSTTVYLVSGMNYPDALVAGGLAARNPGPVLLTGPTLPAVVLDEITRLAPREVVVIGGVASVAEAVVDTVRNAAPA
jgi:putative cell wall-binding protein